MYDTQKPSLDELQHYGKKGMKWGVTNRPSTVQIKSARRRNVENVQKLMDAEDKVTTAKTASAKASAQKTYDKMTKEYEKNPDRVTSRYFTRGEQLVSVVLVGPGTVPLHVAMAAYRQSAKNAAKKANKN